MYDPFFWLYDGDTLGIKSNHNKSESLAVDQWQLSAHVSTDTNTDILDISFLPTGEYPSTSGLKKTFDAQALEQIVSTFNKRKESGTFEPSINYDHKCGPSGGWIKDLKLKGDTLVASVSYTDKGKQSVDSKEYRYFSAEISQGSDGLYGLDHIAFTNNPYIKDGRMSAAFSNNFNNNEDNNMGLFSKNDKGTVKLDVEGAKAAFEGLADNERLELLEVLAGSLESDEAKDKVKELLGIVEESQEVMAEASTQLSAAQNENVQLSQRVADLELTAQTAIKESEFSALLLTGANESQRKAYMSGNMAEYAANQTEAVSLSATGSSIDPISDAAGSGEQITALATEYHDKNGGTYGAALSAVMTGNDNLTTLAIGDK